LHYRHSERRARNLRSRLHCSFLCPIPECLLSVIPGLDPGSPFVFSSFFLFFFLLS
jgi:hypothetical protein